MMNLVNFESKNIFYKLERCRVGLVEPASTRLFYTDELFHS